MRLNRFIGEFDLSEDLVSITDSNQTFQIINVLRLKVGDILVLVGGKIEAKAEIIDFKDGNVQVKIIDRLISENGPQREVNLYLAILKKDNFEWAVQKATECGASSITPIVSERTIKLGLNFDRLYKIAKEAAEQSGRRTLPVIKNSLELKSTLDSLDSHSINIMFDPTGVPISSSEIKTGAVNLFIGPEGGWSPEEIKYFIDSNKFLVLNLGKNILRAETAATVVTYLLSQVYVGN